MSQTILLTGGAGFIGSHIAVELLQDGYDVVIADDLSNSRADVIDRIEKITGRRPAFYRIDAADGAASARLAGGEGAGGYLPRRVALAEKL